MTGLKRILILVALFAAPAMAQPDTLCLGGCPIRCASGDTIVRHHILTLANNPARKLADWVAYRVAPDTIKPGCPRIWKRDPALPPAVTLTPAAYDDARKILHTDRGHQAPLYSLCGSRYWREADYLSNVTPQAAKLNEGPWNALEARVRKLAKRAGSVYVVTGPLYEGSLRRLPARPRVSVPSGYWKVIATVKAGRVTARGYIMGQGIAYHADYRGYCRSLQKIERRAGLRLFPGVPRDKIRQACLK